MKRLTTTVLISAILLMGGFACDEMSDVLRGKSMSATDTRPSPPGTDGEDDSLEPSAIIDAGDPPEESDRPPLIEALPRRLQGVDIQDAPKAPRALLKTSELEDWIKTKPVRLIEDDQVEDWFGQFDLSDAYQSKRIAKPASFLNGTYPRIARCQYSAADKSTRVEVLFIEAEEALQAYNTFSLATPGTPPTIADDRSLRYVVESNNAMLHFAWQGEVFLIVAFQPPDSASAEARQELVDQLIFRIPASNPPVLWRAIPPAMRNHAKVWITPEPHRFATRAVPHVATAAASRLVLELGLEPFSKSEADLDSVARIAPEDQSPIWVWIVDCKDSQTADESMASAQAWISANQAETQPAPGTSELTRPVLHRAGDRYIVGVVADEQAQPLVEQFLPALLEAL